MLKVLLPFCLCSLLLAGDFHERFQLLQVYPKNDEHRLKLESLREDYDIWHGSHDRYDILIPSSRMQSMVNSFLDLDMDSKIVNEDVERDIKEEADRLEQKAPGFDYDNFNNYTECIDELYRIFDKCVPGSSFVCVMKTIGYSVEKKPILSFKILKPALARKAIWIDATTHAREWLTTATIFKIMKYLQDNYKKNTTVTELLDKYDWHFLPIVNPDGYDFSWNKNNTQNRMWRKNRKITSKPGCIGVDLNRNADINWGVSGSSTDPCSETYQGASAASEPEVLALQQQFRTLGKNLMSVVSIHAYGQYWLTPFGHVDPVTKKCFVAKDANETLRVANAAADAIQKVYKTVWKRGPICNTLYPASGNLIDYAKEKAGANHAALPEVRGGGFIVPPTEITPSFNEIWAGIVANIKAIESGPK